MKCHIDFSIFISSPIESKAYGHVHGTLVLPAVPSAGDELSFLFPLGKTMLPKIKGVRWVLSIEKVVFSVGQDQVCLSLQDVVVETKSEADTLVNYFVNGFELDSDCFLDDDLESAD